MKNHQGEKTLSGGERKKEAQDKGLF